MLLATGAFIACGRKLASRYRGWLFVASASERGLAVADLSEFRRVTTIPLSEIPGQVIRAREQVFVTCPEGHVLYEIDPSQLRVSGKIDLPGRIVTGAVLPSGDSIALLTDQPAGLYLITPSNRKIVKRVSLPASPTDFALNDAMAAVTTADSVIRVALPAGKIAGISPIGTRCGAIRFRKDGETILVGAPDAKQIVTLDSATGALLTRLPLTFPPARFCPNGDGGQLFVTGAAGDAIAIMDTYQNQLDQTLVAGNLPLAMAVGEVAGQELLFVTNAGSGDLTIFDIDSRRLAASVHVGGSPGEILLTPDGEYALVIDSKSGDVAVIRMGTVLDRKIKTKPLFTFFAMAAAPQSAAIIPASLQ